MGRIPSEAAARVPQAAGLRGLTLLLALISNVYALGMRTARGRR